MTFRSPETTIQTDAGQVIDEYTDPSASLGTAGELDITRAVATNAIRHQLVQAAAKANGITVDEAEVNQTLASIGENTAGVASELKIPQAQVEDFVRDLAVLQALLKAAPEGGTEVDNPSVVVDYVTADNRDQAVQLRAKFLHDPAAMDAAIKSAPTDPSTGSVDGGQRCRGEPGEEPRPGLVRHLPGRRRATSCSSRPPASRCWWCG